MTEKTGAIVSFAGLLALAIIAGWSIAYVFASVETIVAAVQH